MEGSDGLTDPYRYDKNVVEELEIFATFELSGEEGDGDGEGDEGDQEGDEEAPSEEQGEGEPSDEESESESDDSQESEDDKYNDANQVIDGETYYREIIEEYKDSVGAVGHTANFIEVVIENLDKSTEDLHGKIVTAYAKAQKNGMIFANII